MSWAIAVSVAALYAMAVVGVAAWWLDTTGPGSRRWGLVKDYASLGGRGAGEGVKHAVTYDRSVGNCYTEAIMRVDVVPVGYVYHGYSDGRVKRAGPRMLLRSGGVCRDARGSRRVPAW